MVNITIKLQLTIIGNEFRSPIIQFQIFNSLGGATTDIIDIIIDGLFPMNPSIQVINETIFAITCTGQRVKGDGIFIQQFDQHGKLILDLPSNALCSYKCENCRSPLTCQECSQGYNLNEQKQCIMDCGEDCESCSSPQVCKQCKIGYNLTDNKQCQQIECLEGQIRSLITKQCEQCPQQCKLCKELNQCLECNYGYIIINGQCELLIVDEDFNNREIILIVCVVIQGALLISFVAYSIFQRKQMKQIQIKLNEGQSAILSAGSSAKVDDNESDSLKKL